MKHRHLTHEGFTIVAIEDILARGRMPDWQPLITAIQADPYGEIAEKTRAVRTPLVRSARFSSSACRCAAGTSALTGA